MKALGAGLKRVQGNARLIDKEGEEETAGTASILTWAGVHAASMSSGTYATYSARAVKKELAQGMRRCSVGALAVDLARRC